MPDGRAARDGRALPGGRDLVPAARCPRLFVAGSDLQFPVRRIWCVGRNYAAHAAEMGAPIAQPFFFSKPADAIVACPVTIPYPPETELLHHEVELLVALGRGGRDLDEGTAASCIIAVGVAVDLTRRDVQAVAKAQGRPWALAKGFDHAAPCGELLRVDGPLLGDRTLALWVDGELRQRGDVSQMLWSPAALIAALSRQVRLAAGDVILTGTPAGVGPLRPGQQVRARIDGLPELSFSVAEVNMAMSTAVDVAPEDVLTFWFGAPGTPMQAQFGLWFKKDAEQDQRMRVRFEATLQRAARGELDAWSATPRGRLALVLLLDQLSRNLYRDTPAAFSQDVQARQLCEEGITLGHDVALSPIEAAFLYMPLEHGESLPWQDKSIAAFTALAGRDPNPMLANFLDFAHKHHAIIVRFGRYPHRNAILGREDTPEEAAYLAEPGAGF